MDKITILETTNGQVLTKRFRATDSGFERQQDFRPKFFNVEIVGVEDLQTLSNTLSILENSQTKAVVRGALKDGFPDQNTLRRYAGATDPFRAEARRWICIDLDDLLLPEEFSDFNTHHQEIAQYAASHLPEEFQDVDFHWQFSSSMGVKPGIQIHLWFWLDRPVKDIEAKAWLSGGSTRVDLSLYNPVQLHFTANPIFDPPEADPVEVRSGLFRYGNDISEVSVPSDIEERVAGYDRPNTGIRRVAPNTNRLDNDRIVRDDKGKVVDGRDYFLYQKSLEATQELTKGKDLSKGIPSAEVIAELTWKMFEAEADISDGRWSLADALEKAQYRHRDLLEGWKPNGRIETITLIPDVDPYFQIEAVDADRGFDLLDGHLNKFTDSVLEDVPKQMALRVTMGAGKTTRTFGHLCNLLAQKSDLNVEIYLPRHDIIEEVIGQFDGVKEVVDIIHMRGRTDIDKDGSALCQRHEYVKSLEEAGLSVRPNACRRSDHEICEHYDDCAYWKQFWNNPDKISSVRLFPHAYLAIPRVDMLPNPDIVVIDEAFLPALHKKLTKPAETVRTLFRETDHQDLGNVIVDALRDADPLLSRLREQGIDSNWLEEINFRERYENPVFNSTRSQASSNLNGSDERRIRFAEALMDILAEELGLDDREHISRLKFDSRTNEVVIDRLAVEEMPRADHLLLLDATADRMVLEKLFPEVEFHRVDFEQRAIVTQVYDRTGSNKSWNEGEDKTGDLVLVLKEQTLVGDKVLCVSHKQLADTLREKELGEQIAIQHFGNLRGIDEHKDCDTIFVTGRNQPPQSGVDGLARALWWNDEEPLQHDDAALLGALPETNLPTELRGYLTTDPDEAAGVYVRSFSDSRIEAVHQQMREAETVQAIARLRLVHAKKLKQIYLLGNLPIEMPIHRLVEWNDLMLDRAERELMEKGNIPLTPKGWEIMRPDIVKSANEAKNRNKRSRLNEHQELLQATPLLLRLNLDKVEFRQLKDGKPYGRTHAHLFRSENISIDKEGPGTVMVSDVSADKWKRFLEEDDPEMPNTGWGPIEIIDVDWLDNPSDIIAYANVEPETD